MITALVPLLLASGWVPVTSNWLERAPCAPKPPPGHVRRYAHLRSVPAEAVPSLNVPGDGKCEHELSTVSQGLARSPFAPGAVLAAIDQQGAQGPATVLGLHAVLGFGDGCATRFVFVASVAVPEALGEVVAFLPSGPSGAAPMPAAQVPEQVRAVASSLWRRSHGKRPKVAERIAFSPAPEGRFLAAFDGPARPPGEGGYVRVVRHLASLSAEGRVTAYQRFEHFYGPARYLGFAPLGEKSEPRAVFVGPCSTVSYAESGRAIETTTFCCD